MNRKKRSSTVRFGPALKAVLICLVTCSLGLGYVWQKQQINSLGQQIKENEIVLEELKRENKRRGDNLAYLMSPQELDARLRQLKLDLVVPKPEQIVVLQELRGIKSVYHSKTEVSPVRTASR
ncbi:MAG: hypothetical protein P8M70_01100 [Verrucomicrobiota bacterium]|jgi:hypothetical protein|nr:hypothetical protein [Verrucomicrobiota bacterium]|tara:strand:+ start:1006 stop:1374 length:369 start_codon:yes stop_codon:yes gene_type:complete